MALFLLYQKIYDILKKSWWQILDMGSDMLVISSAFSLGNAAFLKVGDCQE